MDHISRWYDLELKMFILIFNPFLCMLVWYKHIFLGISQGGNSVNCKGFPYTIRHRGRYRNTSVKVHALYGSKHCKDVHTANLHL